MFLGFDSGYLYLLGSLFDILKFEKEFLGFWLW